MTPSRMITILICLIKYLLFDNDLAKSVFLNAVFIFIKVVDGYYTLGSAHIVSVQLCELSSHEHV